MTDKVLATYEGQQEIAEAIRGINLEALTQKAVWVDSVADMRELDAPQGITVATRGYYEPNDGGNGFYVIRAKEVGAVDDGGSVIFLDNDNEAKLITDGEVSVEQFGAHGDGVAHVVDGVDKEAQAIQNAITFSDNVVLQKSYSISAPIVISKTMKLHVNGTITYTGNDACIKYIGTTQCYSYINEIIASNGTGILLGNDTRMNYENVFHIDRIYASVCVEEYSTDSHGVQYNSYYVNKIHGISKCFYMHVQNDTLGWTGETMIFGGHLAGNASVGIYAVKSTGVKVFGTGFETLGHAMYVEDSGNIFLTGCRNEDTARIASPSYQFKLVGTIKNMRVSGFYYNIKNIDISGLTSTDFSYIVFDGDINVGSGVNAGRQMIIGDGLIPYFEGANHYVRNSGYYGYSTYWIMGANDSIGVVGATDNTAMNPRTLQASGDCTIGDRYRIDLCDEFYIYCNGSGIKIKDSDGTVMVTTTDAKSIYHVRAMGRSSSGATVGKNCLLFTKIFPSS